MALLTIPGTIAHAANTDLSAFFQDWKLKSGASGCAKLLTGYAENDVPGTSGIPRESLDSSQAVRFIPDDTEATEVLTLGSNPSSVSDGTTVVTLSGEKLNVVDQILVGFFRPKLQILRTDSYTLLPNVGLQISRQEGSETPTLCTYDNLHPELTGLSQTGAALMSNGVKIAECKFVPATPRADQPSAHYTEACLFGKYTIKSVIDSGGRTLSEEVIANETTPHEMQLVRSTSHLNTETELWFSRDTEIAVEDSHVDSIYPSIDEYYVNPYRIDHYAITGTHATIQFVYSSKP